MQPGGHNRSGTCFKFAQRHHGHPASRRAYLSAPAPLSGRLLAIYSDDFFGPP